MPPLHFSPSTLEASTCQLAGGFPGSALFTAHKFNDGPADLEFGVVQDELAILHLVAVGRIVMSEIIRVRHAALSRLRTDFQAIDPTDYDGLGNPVMSGNLGGGMPFLKVQSLNFC